MSLTQTLFAALVTLGFYRFFGEKGCAIALMFFEVCFFAFLISKALTGQLSDLF